MSIRSDVLLAIHRDVEIPEDLQKRLFEEASNVLREDGHTLFVFNSVLWYPNITGELADDVIQWYSSEIDEQIFCVVANSEYPDPENYFGNWHDNPWNVSLYISASVAFEGCGTYLK